MKSFIICTPPNNIRVMKSRRKRGVKHAAGIGDIRNAHTI
jgi:hypothetical protein